MKNGSLWDIHFAQPGFRSPKRWLGKHLFHCLIDLTVRTLLPCNQYAFFPPLFFLNFISRFEGQKGPFGRFALISSINVRDPCHYLHFNCYSTSSSGPLHLYGQISPFPSLYSLWSYSMHPLGTLHCCIQSSFPSFLLLQTRSSNKPRLSPS